MLRVAAAELAFLRRKGQTAKTALWHFLSLMRLEIIVVQLLGHLIGSVWFIGMPPIGLFKTTLFKQSPACFLKAGLFTPHASKAGFDSVIIRLKREVLAFAEVKTSNATKKKSLKLKDTIVANCLN
jgi:hypothetical protein